MLPSNNLWKRNKTDEWCYSDESLREKKINSSDDLWSRQDKCLHAVLVSNTKNALLLLSHLSLLVFSTSDEDIHRRPWAGKRHSILRRGWLVSYIVASLSNLQLQTSSLLMIIDRSESTTSTLHPNRIHTSINSWIRLISARSMAFNRAIFHNARGYDTLTFDEIDSQHPHPSVVRARLASQAQR